MGGVARTGSHLPRGGPPRRDPRRAGRRTSLLARLWMWKPPPPSLEPRGPAWDGPGTSMRSAGGRGQPLSDPANQRPRTGLPSEKATMVAMYTQFTINESSKRRCGRSPNALTISSAIRSGEGFKSGRIGSPDPGRAQIKRDRGPHARTIKAKRPQMELEHHGKREGATDPGTI